MTTKQRNAPQIVTLEELEELKKTSPYVDKMLARIQETGKKPSYPLSAFCMYSQQQRDKLKAEHPEIPQTIILEQIRKQWKTVSTKQQYLDRAKADYQHYKRLLAYWENTFKGKEFVPPEKEESKDDNTSLIGKRGSPSRVHEPIKPISRNTGTLKITIQLDSQPSVPTAPHTETADEPARRSSGDEDDDDGSESGTSSASGESEEYNGGFDIKDPFVPTASFAQNKIGDLGGPDLFLKPQRCELERPTGEKAGAEGLEQEFRVSSFQTSCFLPVAAELKHGIEEKDANLNFHCNSMKPVQRNTVDLHNLLPQVNLFNGHANKRKEKADYKITREVIEDFSIDSRHCTDHYPSPERLRDVDELSACEFELKHSVAEMEQMDIVPDLATLEECIGPKRACSGLPLWQMEHLELDMHSENSYKRQRFPGQI